MSVGSAKGTVAELRSLLRFLFIEGLTDTALAVSVPPVAGWRDTALPPTLTRAQVEAIAAAAGVVDGPTGSRNRAIVFLLARLGLRAAEVGGLGLADIDWRAGEVVVRGKGRREERLPLPRRWAKRSPASSVAASALAIPRGSDDRLLPVTGSAACDRSTSMKQKRRRARRLATNFCVVLTDTAADSSCRQLGVTALLQLLASRVSRVVVRGPLAPFVFDLCSLLSPARRPRVSRSGSFSEAAGRPGLTSPRCTGMPTLRAGAS